MVPLQRTNPCPLSNVHMYVRVSGDEIFRERYDIIAIIIIIIWTQFNFSTLHVSECRQSSAFRSA